MKKKSLFGKLKLKTRLFLQVALIFAVCLSVILLLNSRYMENAYLWYEKRHIINMVEEIEKLQNIELTYYSELPSFEQRNDVSIKLYTEFSEPLYDNTTKISLSNKKIDVLSREVNESDKSYFLVLSEEGSDLQYNVYGRTLKNGYLIEVISLISPTAQSELLANSFTAVLSLIGFSLSLIVISLFARRFAKPLEELSEITGEMAKLDFKRKCKTNRNDEIGALAKNINHLSVSLDNALFELEEKNEQLLKDIDRERKLDGIRKEFISSVSHELKTPISIIKGYAEGLTALEKEERETAEEYSRIILSEADRMNELVRTLLEISLYESGGYVLKEGFFSIGKTISEYLLVSRPIFTEKGIAVKNTVPESVMVKGDADKLYTVINNYLQNAVSHCRGEKKIICRHEENGDVIRIIVYNTGEHIKQEDSDKLFLSFYRADKSHSREEGRIGLGLSIVKAIMDVHNMNYGYNNARDGVEFWFEIKKATEEEVGGIGFED
ncbi:MAG: Alkaline phosphatase synthesis sensor protein PhoR [Firmicutes bacterium ADurb.Bin300]|nr:MAG: Alkaline phosphatase synthesis sensor protein PhoR [Firmicutes bacterium ADurb.Bin300]